MKTLPQTKNNKSFYSDAIRRWTEINAPVGRKLGYPECCIKAFCDQPPEILATMSVTPSDQMRFEASKINGVYTGFIPCHEHAKEILSGKITLESLIKNRAIDIANFPFV